MSLLEQDQEQDQEQEQARLRASRKPTRPSQ